MPGTLNTPFTCPEDSNETARGTKENVSEEVSNKLNPFGERAFKGPYVRTVLPDAQTNQNANTHNNISIETTKTPQNRLQRSKTKKQTEKPGLALTK
jgi:hypothetical protein